MSHSLCTLPCNSSLNNKLTQSQWILCAKTTTTKYYYFCVSAAFLCCVAIAYTILLLHVHDDRIKAIAINESHTSAWTARWRRHYSDPFNWWAAPSRFKCILYICHSRRTFACRPIKSQEKKAVHFVWLCIHKASLIPLTSSSQLKWSHSLHHTIHIRRPCVI